LPAAEIAVFVADRIRDVCTQKSVQGRTVNIGLTTGTTPLTTGIYEELVQRSKRGELPLSNVAFFNPDEFLGLPDDHKESYHVYTERHFLQHLSADGSPAAWHIPSGAAADPQAECDRMERAVVEAGGIDFQLLGVGINGHVCFIEPAAALPAACFVTPIAQVNRQLYAADFGSVESVPTHAITFGLGTLLRARELCLVAVGARKADIVRRALCDGVSTLFPASFLQTHANVVVVLDAEAAAALPLDALRMRPGVRVFGSAASS
jgi:glucosamine-6-phosphate deaminase